jgi:hypothetical protein
MQPQPGQNTSQATFDARIYYMAKGSYVYLVTNSLTRQTSPYKTTDQNFTDDNARDALKLIHKARLYAERTGK